MQGVNGKRIVLTGHFSAYDRRKAIVARIKKAGGWSSFHATVTGTTDVLVKGYSENHKHDEFGNKERDAAEQIVKGRNVVVIDEADFEKLMAGKRVKPLTKIAGRALKDLLRERATAEKAALAPIKALYDDESLDVETVTYARLEQALLRRRLFGDATEAACVMCHQVLPVDLLRCAHLKPRRVCTRKERLDVAHVVVGMCTLGCDSLYELGYIGVSKTGLIRVAKRSAPTALAAGLKRLKGRTLLDFNSGMATYVESHGRETFRG